MGACTYKFLRILLLIVSVTAICVGLKPSFQKVTFRRSSWTRTALKGELLDSAGEIGDVAAKVGSVAADSTTAAISNFAVPVASDPELSSFHAHLKSQPLEYALARSSRRRWSTWHTRSQ